MGQVRLALRSAGTSVVEVRGELCAGAVDPLDETFQRLVADGDDCVLLDLSAVPRIDEAAIASLVSLSRRVGAIGGRVIILDAHRAVHEALDGAGLTGLLHTTLPQPA